MTHVTSLMRASYIIWWYIAFCVTNLHWVKESNRRGGPNCNSLRGKEYVAFIVFVLSSDAPRKRSGERYFIHLWCSFLRGEMFWFCMTRSWHRKPKVAFKMTTSSTRLIDSFIHLLHLEGSKTTFDSNSLSFSFFFFFLHSTRYNCPFGTLLCWCIINDTRSSLSIIRIYI